MARLGKPGNSSVYDVSGSASRNRCAFTENRQNQRGQRSSLTISADSLRKIYDNIDYFASRIVLRPQEILITRKSFVVWASSLWNVGLEFDIYGHANSTHVAGVDLMNGTVAVAGDFELNAYLTIFMAPSIGRQDLNRRQCAAMLITANTASK